MKLLNVLLIGLAVLLISQAFADDGNETLLPLQGTWSMVSGSTNGMPIPEPMRAQMKRICKDDQLTTTVGPQILFKATIGLDASKNPKTIDYQMTEGVAKGKTQLGIYEFDGGKLKTSFAAPGEARPTDFTTTAGDHRTFTTWQRDNPTTQPAGK